MRVPFSKMHGAGNDYVVVDCTGGDPVSDWAAFARFALDRHRGVGGDQLLRVAAPRSPTADFFMGILNADGSTAEMCGNGVRAFHKFVLDRGLTRSLEISLDTLGGIVRSRALGEDRFEVEMPVPILSPEKIPTTLAGPVPLLDVALRVGDRELAVTPISMGNPHCVIFVEDPEAVEVEVLGPLIEQHAAFPARTNVEFVGVETPQLLVQRTWERGVGETLACGSGACAAAAAAILSGRSDRALEIRLRGGTLGLRWPSNESPIHLSGPAAHVFDSELELA